MRRETAALLLCAPLLIPACFRDVAEEAGLTFVLANNPTEEKRLIETMPGGLAIFDYDNDGRPDIYFTNGASIPSLKKDSVRYWNRLFHNEGGLKFRDVTQSAGVRGEGYSMGATAGDFDNDGHADLFVTGVYRNTLFRNLGNGSFEDVTGKSGIKQDEWSVAAGFFDYDNDGRLDLFVVSYGRWPTSGERFCGDASRGLRVYCHPRYYEPRPNHLYRNMGNGRFEDVSVSSGIASAKGRGMGVAFADYDRDGRMDVFVTNDNLPNFLFHNQSDGTFEETALTAGAALLDTGKPVASMGTDFRDYDNDGWPDIAFVALTGETFPIFRNQHDGTFRDATYSSRIGPLTTRLAGWGAVWSDFDNDGWKDLFTSNSHVNDLVERFEATTYKQANTVFHNRGNGTFANATCPELQSGVRAHRGLAAADIDGDGKLDLVISSLGDRAELWHNTVADAGHWIIVRLQGNKSNRDGIGAAVQIGQQRNTVSPAQGYSSASLTGLHFGLGAAAVVPLIEVTWPNGFVQTLKNVPADQVLRITEP